MTRWTIASLACLFLAACSSAPTAPVRMAVPAAPAPVSPVGPAVVASTLEVRLDTTALGGRAVDGSHGIDALASVTVTEFLPAHGSAVIPVLGSRVEDERMITEFSPNAFRLTVHAAEHGIAHLGHGAVAPGWYAVYGYGSTAGFDMEQPRRGQRVCMLPGLTPAPGVRPVELRAGEVGYFGHFVVTIALRPRADGAPGYGLDTIDAAIEPAPAGLDAMMRGAGLDPARVRRIETDRFPCPWVVARPGSG